MAEERLEEIRSQRLAKRQALIDAGLFPYPSEVRSSHTLAKVREQFDQLMKDTTPLILLGRVVSLRKHGGLVFADLQDASATLQLQMTRDDIAEEIWNRLEHLDTGDWVQVTGTLILTKRDVQTLHVTGLTIVSKSIRPLPDTWYGLKDHETRYRQREVDLLLNTEVRTLFETRAKIVRWLREHLSTQGFLEVETPILQPIVGGAAAKPFITHHNALDVPLYLRIAPELYLKRLLVGGFEKVFEIGRNFRNEGIDRQHNPEFTMLEFYWAYTDYEDLMDFTETMLEKMVRELFDTSDIPWQDTTLSFDVPFRRERYIDLVSNTIGINILEEKNPEAYIEVFKQHNLEIPQAKTYTKLVDELYKELVRPQLVQPTLVYDYPVEMVPLAKQNLTDPRVAEKFQLLIAGAEIVNAYTELNDPVEQRARFEQQQADREKGDEEAQAIDEAYLRAMEYGMPPTGGYGLGVDRLTMFLTNTSHLRDTILFPLMRPEHND
jgi:lysyl-tRNA synthetase, class II